MFLLCEPRLAPAAGKPGLYKRPHWVGGREKKEMPSPQPSPKGLDVSHISFAGHRRSCGKPSKSKVFCCAFRPSGGSERWGLLRASTLWPRFPAGFGNATVSSQKDMGKDQLLGERAGVRAELFFVVAPGEISPTAAPVHCRVRSPDSKILEAHDARADRSMPTRRARRAAADETLALACLLSNRRV